MVNFDHFFKIVVQINLRLGHNQGRRVLNKEIIYSLKDIKSIILGTSPNNISQVALHKRINNWIDSRKLVRIGRGQYIIAKRYKFSYELEKPTSIAILNFLKKKLHKTARFIVYETSILNYYLNHLIARATIIVEVEKDIAEFVFWMLKDEGFGNVLYNPDSDENYRYNPYDGSGVIVKSMSIRAPINNKLHQLTIEKLAVDIVCDKTMNMFYEGAEIRNMLEDIFEQYAIRYDTLRNYAQRRHCYDKLLKILETETNYTFI